MKNKVLHLPLKAKWYNMIENGDKFWNVIGYQSDVAYWMEIPEIKRS